MVFHREHNRIARELKKLIPAATDATLFMVTFIFCFFPAAKPKN
jgi:hypothetical protein